MRIALGLVAVASAGCVKSLDHTQPSIGSGCQVSTNDVTCVAADELQEASLSYLETNILKPLCSFSECHDSTIKDAFTDFRTQDAAYASLVNFPSRLAGSDRLIVVPGDVNKSFLSVMIGLIPPEEADPPLDAIPSDPSNNYFGVTMPDGAGLLCCQKLDAFARWIGSGAPND